MELDLRMHFIESKFPFTLFDLNINSVQYIHFSQQTKSCQKWYQTGKTTSPSQKKLRNWLNARCTFLFATSPPNSNPWITSRLSKQQVSPGQAFKFLFDGVHFHQLWSFYHSVCGGVRCDDERQRECLHCRHLWWPCSITSSTHTRRRRRRFDRSSLFNWFNFVRCGWLLWNHHLTHSTNCFTFAIIPLSWLRLRSWVKRCATDQSTIRPTASSSNQ